MKTKLSILVVDDDKNIRTTLTVTLRNLGHDVDASESVSRAEERLEARSFDLVLTDYRMERQTGIDLLKKVKLLRPETITVVMTAYASIEHAVNVIKEGAWDYLPKPFSNTQLSSLLARVQLLVSLRRENDELKLYRHRRDYFAGATSPAMARLEEFVKKVAPTESTILLTGESGTGKSELARLIYELSTRRERPFVSVFCTTVVESLLESELFGHAAGAFTGATSTKRGKFELAEGGTLFLDEIGDLSPSAQSKLLRFLQDRVIEPVGSNKEIVVDARVIAATNKNLKEAVEAGKFREDLYFRLNMFECPLVGLRHRKEDIPVLVRRFLDEARVLAKRSNPIELNEAVRERLLSYRWPGNVRELRNVIERLTVLASNRPAAIEDLPDAIRDWTSDAHAEGTLQTLEDVERRHIAHVLENTKSLETAAEVLGITTVTLWRKRKEYGLH